MIRICKSLLRNLICPVFSSLFSIYTAIHLFNNTPKHPPSTDPDVIILTFIGQGQSLLLLQIANNELEEARGIFTPSNTIY